MYYVDYQSLLSDKVVPYAPRKKKTKLGKVFDYIDNQRLFFFYVLRQYTVSKKYGRSLSDGFFQERREKPFQIFRKEQDSRVEKAGNMLPAF